MHVLLVSQFHPPELGAAAGRVADLARLWAARGERVTVLTTWPHFPRGRIYSGYRQAPWAEHRDGGVRVLRTPVLALGGDRPARKAVLFASFAVSALVQGALRDLRPDVVVGTVPPPTVGYVSHLLARLFGVPHVLDVRDIWPEAVVASGRLRPGPAVVAMERLNRRVLANSAAVVAVTRGKRDRLIELGAPPEHATVIPNGVDLQRFDAAVAAGGTEAGGMETGRTQAGDKPAGGDAARDWRAMGVPEGAAAIVYAGVFNRAQGLELVVEVAAARAAAGLVSPRFVLIGDGSEGTWLRARSRRLPNLHVGGPLPRSRVPALLARATAGLVILRPRRDDHTVPAKLFECMASGRPVLVSADGQARRIVEQARAGLVSPAGDAPALSRAVRALLADPGAARQMGFRGRALVRRRYERAALAADYRELLRRVAGR